MDNLNNLKKLLDTMKDDHLGREEFMSAFNKVLDFVVKVEQKNSETVDKLEQTYNALNDKIQNNHNLSLEELKKRTNQLFVGEKLNEMHLEHRQRMTEVTDKLTNVKDGKDGESIKGDKGEDGLDGSPDEPIDIVDKLESLPERDKLAIEAIKGLRKELDDVKKSASKTVYTGGGTSRGQVKAYDISASLNGVLKTFALPAFWRIISIQSSSFPNAFRETIDWTQDASAMTITFTSAIDATTTLATGQTIIIIYAEA